MVFQVELNDGGGALRGAFSGVADGAMPQTPRASPGVQVASNFRGTLESASDAGVLGLPATPENIQKGIDNVAAWSQKSKAGPSLEVKIGPKGMI